MLREGKSPPRPLQCRREARWRPLASERISYNVPGNVKVSGKVIMDPRLESDQHQNLTNSVKSPLARAY